MAIRTISYSVKSDGISPNTDQQAGLQSEHAVTQLVFTLDNKLYQALLSEKQVGDSLVYRFDCCDSMGGAVKTEPSALTSDTVTFTVGENLTRSGGKARVYLVISRYNAEEKTETELLSFPAKLRFENVPETDSNNGNSRESLSTLTEAAKNAAARAEQSADTAVEAQGKTEAARLAIEGDSTVIFDGNGTYGEMDVDFVVDTEFSDFSGNAIANKAVTKKLSRNLSDRYILFIGDSYSCDWGANENNGWCKSCIKFITSAFGKEGNTTFQEEHYKIIAQGGVGFSATASDKNIYQYLEAFIGENAEFIKKVTDVIFALGYNDAAKRAASDSKTDVEIDVQSNIKKCNDIIIQNVPHYVNKYLFAVGWGSNPNIRYSAYIMYKNVYSCATELGWIYTDLRYVMYDSVLYYDDWVHPNKEGSDKIAFRIVNTLLGNSADVVCDDRLFTNTDGVNVGQLHIVNNELAQFYLRTNVIYDGDLITLGVYNDNIAELCEIVDLVPFGIQYQNYLSNVSFHIIDTLNKTESNVMLSCWISKRLYETTEGHEKYKSYLNIRNTTGSEIKFNKLAPNNGVINIVPYL